MRRYIVLVVAALAALALAAAASANVRSNNPGQGNDGNNGGTIVCVAGTEVQVNGNFLAVLNYLLHHPGATLGHCPTPPPPTDVCPNIEGIQLTSTGYTVVEGQCIPDVPPPTDVCPNIEGIQPTTTGYTVVDGQCIVTPPIVTPPVVTPPAVLPVITVPGHMFLCYSKFAGSTPGVYLLGAPLTEGLFVPFAVAGAVQGGNNLGPYHLVCNVDGLKATGRVVDGSGQTYGSDYVKAFFGYWKTTANLYAIYS